MKKGILTGILSLVCLLFLSACGGDQMTTEDATDYLKSILDANYKADFTEYVEQTGATEEEAQESYDAIIDNTMEGLGLTDLGVSDELNKKFRELFVELSSLANYEMGEAKSTEDGFEVTVIVYPFQGFAGLQEEIVERAQTDLENLEEYPQDDAAMNEFIMTEMYDLMSEAIADPTYGDYEECTVHVNESEESYEIPEDDLTAVDNALFPNNL